MLDRDPIASLLASDGIVAMQADWTRPDPSISAYLERFNRFGIPFNAVYGPAAPNGIALPELLSTDAILSVPSTTPPETYLTPRIPSLARKYPGGEAAGRGGKAP